MLRNRIDFRYLSYLEPLIWEILPIEMKETEIQFEVTKIKS